VGHSLLQQALFAYMHLPLLIHSLQHACMPLRRGGVTLQAACLLCMPGAVCCYRSCCTECYIFEGARQTAVCKGALAQVPCPAQHPVGD
jgi:hypothetical protein